MLPSASRGLIEVELDRLRRPFFRKLDFSEVLEAQFERDTAKERSHRLWLEGFLAILMLNGCLLLDYFLVPDAGWKSIIFRTMLVTPVALAINLFVLRNPEKWLREGSVAVGTTIICFINLSAQGNRTAATTAYGLICVLITVLFADLVMRIRFRYAATATVAMLSGALWSLGHAPGLQVSEKIVAASLLAVGVAITIMASYSLEREERLGYLLHLRSGVQAQELMALNAQLQELSAVDELTGLPNRRAFEERFEKCWVDAERSKAPLSAIILDLDNFKVVNDKRGHVYGDMVLHRIAAVLPQGLRGHGDFVARFGGEEFVVLLPNTELDKAVIVAERIRCLVELSGTPVAQPISGEAATWATISCGVSVCVPARDTHRDNLLIAADEALYAAKAGGRNQVRYTSHPNRDA